MNATILARVKEYKGIGHHIFMFLKYICILFRNKVEKVIMSVRMHLFKSQKMRLYKKAFIDYWTLVLTESLTFARIIVGTLVGSLYSRLRFLE